MKKIIKKVLVTLGVLLVLLVGVAILIPIIYKDKIIDYVRAEANKRINAKLDFGNDIGISILKTFPDLSVSVPDIKIINKAPFDGDTLMSIGEFRTTVDVMSVLKGDMLKIKTLVLNEPRIFLKRLTDGRSNWSIAYQSNEEIKGKGGDTTSKFRLALNHYELNNGLLVVDDGPTTFYLKMENLNHSGSGDFTKNNLELNTNTTSSALTMIFRKVPYLSRVKTSLKAGIDLDQEKFKFTFRENELQLNELKTKFDGWFAMPYDDMNMDIKFGSPQTDFRSILSLIPAVYKNSFDKIQCSGSMGLKGFIKGTYSDKDFPGFSLAMNIANGMFRYPDLPEAVKDVNMQLNVASPGGDFDNTVVQIPQMHFALGNDPFDVKILVKTPISDPDIDGAVKGKIVLDNMKKMVKLDAGTELSGTAKTDISFKGKMSSIDKKEYDKFHFSGNITCADMGMSYSALPAKVFISHSSMDFNPKNVKLNDCSIKIGRSDMQMKGYLNNLLGWFFRKNELLKGELDFTSSLIDANELMPAQKTTEKTEAKTTAATDKKESKTTAIDLPGNIDFTLKSTIAQFKYDKWDITNLRGVFHLADKRITFSGVTLSMLGATAKMDGYYDSKNLKEPKADMKVSLTDVDIRLAYDAFESMKKFAPVAQYTKGNMDMNLQFNSDLGADMKPVWSTFNSKGNLLVKKASIEEYEPMNQVATKLNMPEFRRLELNNIRPAFRIENGKLSLDDSIRFMVNNVKARIGGYTTLDENLFHDLVMNVPVKHLKEQVSGELNKVFKNKFSNEIPLSNSVRVETQIRGTVHKPALQFNLKQIVGSMTDAVKQKAKEELDKQKKILEQKVEAEKQKAMQEAERKKQEAENEARRRAEEEKRKQEAAIKKQADDQKKKLEDEAKKKLNNLFRK